MTTLAFLLSELSPLLVFEFDFVSALETNTLRNILMLLCRNVRTEQDDMMRTKMTTLAFLLLDLSPLLVFEIDFVSAL